MDWKMIGMALLIWCLAGLLTAIAFGRATGKDKEKSTSHHG